VFSISNLALILGHPLYVVIRYDLSIYLFFVWRIAILFGVDRLIVGGDSVLYYICTSKLISRDLE